MAAPPKSVMKINKKDGVTFISSVDFASYTLHELTRAALKDVGKYVVKEARIKTKRKTGRGAKNIQHWVRAKQDIPDLQVGIKGAGFYLGFHEVGAKGITKNAAIYNSVSENIPMIIKIQSQYLSGMNNLEAAQSQINEGEEQGE